MDDNKGWHGWNRDGDAKLFITRTRTACTRMLGEAIFKYLNNVSSRNEAAAASDVNGVRRVSFIKIFSILHTLCIFRATTYYNKPTDDDEDDDDKKLYLRWEEKKIKTRVRSSTSLFLCAVFDKPPPQDEKVEAGTHPFLVCRNRSSYTVLVVVVV